MNQKNRTRKKSKRLGLSFFVIALPISFVISILILSLVLFFVFKGSYNSWESKFENEHLSTDFIKVNKDDLKDVETAIEKFKKSTKKTDFIEIKASSFINLMGVNINENIPSRIKIKKAYVETRDGFWNIYFKADIKGVTSLWFYFDLNKDSVESTDLYITDFKIGDFSVKDWGGDGLINDINSGIKDAMVLLTQKDSRC